TNPLGGGTAERILLRQHILDAPRRVFPLAADDLVCLAEGYALRGQLIGGVGCQKERTPRGGAHALPVEGQTPEQRGQSEEHRAKRGANAEQRLLVVLQ